MRVYVAAPLAQAVTAHAVGEMLRPEHEAVSRWPGNVLELAADRDPSRIEDRCAVLRTNVVDLELADVVVALCHVGDGRATYAEIGYALALRLPVVWVQGGRGEGRNIFDAHDLVHAVIVERDVPLGSLVGLVRTALEDCRGEVAANQRDQRRAESA